MMNTAPIHLPNRMYFRIGEVANLLGVKPYVLRYWESEFPMINPQKSASGQRVYRKTDVEMVVVIKYLLHEERFSIEGAKKRLKELRKDGGLKVLKAESLEPAKAVEEVGATEPVPQETSQEVARELAKEEKRREKVLACASELRELLLIPFDTIFQY